MRSGLKNREKDRRAFCLKDTRIDHISDTLDEEDCHAPLSGMWPGES